MIRVLEAVRDALRGAKPRTILVVAWAFMLLYAFPGYMNWDSGEQLFQLRQNQYGDWHPPVMAAYWRVIELFIRGPFGMFVLQTVAVPVGPVRDREAALRGAGGGVDRGGAVPVPADLHADGCRVEGRADGVALTTACAASAACGGDGGTSPGSRVLAYSRTLGFRHDSIAAGQAALTARLADDGVVVETTEDPLRFRAEELATFDSVVFLYTTGNDVLDAEGKAAFEAFVRDGGGWAGVHSAADTEFEWPFYAGLVVAYFDSHPVPQPATVHVEDAAHPATAGAPEPWMVTDEWYNFRTNARATTGVRVLLTIDEATYTGGNMGADHPLAWAHERAGGRAFYTALGHAADRWSDPVFVDHVAGGVRWTLHRE